MIKVWLILKRFAGTIHQTQIVKLWGVEFYRQVDIVLYTSCTLDENVNELLYIVRMESFALDNFVSNAQHQWLQKLVSLPTASYDTISAWEILDIFFSDYHGIL